MRLSFKDKFSEIRRMSRNHATLLPLKGVFIDKIAFSWYNYLMDKAFLKL